MKFRGTRNLLAALLLFWAWQPLLAAPVEIPGPCSKTLSPHSHQLFERGERARTARFFGLRDLFIDTFPSEKSLVESALALFGKYSPGLKAREKAILWEVLANEVDRALPGNDHQVSYGFLRPTANGMTYVFQGPLRFKDGLHYTLLIDAEGRVFRGLAPVIGDIRRWTYSGFK